MECSRYSVVGAESSEGRGGAASSWIRRAVASGLLVAVLAATCLATWLRRHQRLLQSSVEHDLIQASSIEQDHASCGVLKQDSDIVGIAELRRLADIPDAGVCCTFCQADPACRAWTWTKEDGAAGEGLAGVCSLRHLEPGQKPNSVDAPGVVAGLPFRRPVRGSLFCYALVRLGSYEETLVRMQHQQRTSIFGCDEYAVYSNQVAEVAPGVNTSIVQSDLKCEKGGEFKTALNNDIFMAVWAKVIEDGRFKYNDWTVKVDPDCVFFPTRLRIAVSFHEPPPEGVYLNNCKFGLHGPIEVFSREAVSRWSAGRARCMAHFTKLCSGPCLWGEDMFIDQCLMKVLKVMRVNDWNLLSEDHCASDDWRYCTNGNIAFHPFKTLSEYETCMFNANYGALPVA